MALSKKEKMISELVGDMKKLCREEPPVERKTIGLIEQIIIKGVKKEKIVNAKVDTGATRSSIDSKILKEIGSPKEIRKVLVRTAQGQETRPLVNLQIKLPNGEWTTNTFTVSTRGEMKYKMLLGRNGLIKLNVLIDPIKQVKRDLKKTLNEGKKIITA